MESKIEDDDVTTLALAKEFTRTAVGYCLDSSGQITQEDDAVVCIGDGGSWVEGALAEFVRNLQVSKGGSSASINDIRQVFEDKDGNLVARGGMTNDVNGRVSGFVNNNDGEVGKFDIISDVFRVGTVLSDGSTFIPSLYLDQTDAANPVMVFKGRLELGDGTNVDNIDDIRANDGSNGNRGAGRYEAATSNGYWSDAVANAVTPDGFPVVDDVVTIYKSSDPSYQNTRRYNGSSWISFQLHVHGDALIEGTLKGDVLIAGTRIRSPKIESIGEEYMLISSSEGFGVGSKFMEWYGRNQLINGEVDYTNLRKSNAITYRTVDGDAYLSGTLISGDLNTSKATSDLTDTANVQISVGSNEGLIAVNYSVSINSQLNSTSSSQPSEPPEPSCTIVFEQYVNGVLSATESQSLVGESSITSGYESEGSGFWVNSGSQSLNRGFTFYDSEYSSAVREYRLRITSRSGFRQGSGWTPSQRLSLTSSEG